MLTYRQDGQARRNGVDLVISLTADQAAALGSDVATLAEAFDTVLVGLAALRSGRDPVVPPDSTSLKDQPVSAGPVWDEWLIRDVSYLRGRLAGVGAAAIRAHDGHGGGLAEVVRAMGAKKPTVQRRRDTVLRAVPTTAELWATTCPASGNDVAE
ncbi:hypothetical protein [Micromonospora aurantiaca (nom. illeg.)]|uniref:hypothetical protein n=1 Tax=Micromonospora aurantiaca (nom. illeg.) TaxID=47850 RepID=UPI0033C9CACA